MKTWEIGVQGILVAFRHKNDDMYSTAAGQLLCSRKKR